MIKKSSMMMLAGLACLYLAFPCAAEDEAFETEITIDLDELDLENGEAEIDLGELFADEGYDYEEDGDYEESDDFIEENSEVYWYTVRYHEDEQDMVMLNDVIVYLPESWTGQYDMIIRDDRVDFYHTKSRAGWTLKGEDAGLLFSVCTSTDDSYTEVPEFQDMGQGSDGLYYYLMFPSDAQAYPDDEEIRAGYEELYAQIDRVKEESFSLNDYYVGAEEFEGMTEEETE